MVYQVTALDDAVAVDADSLISLTPQAIAMMAQAPARDAQPPREAPYAVFVRDVKIGGLMAPALWDLGVQPFCHSIFAGHAATEPGDRFRGDLQLDDRWGSEPHPRDHVR